MEQEPSANGGIAALQNVIEFDTQVRRLMSAKPNLPKLGVFFGPSGYGKSYSATYAANEHGAYHVQVGYSWTKKFFCEAVLVEMGMPRMPGQPRESIPEMIAKIARQLALSKKLLIVDDAQYLTQKGMIEIVRDIYEASQSPIILIGEEGLPGFLKRWERVHNRVLCWLEAKPCNVRDCMALARIICEGVDVTNDLLEAVCREVKGNTRRIVTNLDQIREFATARAMTAISAAEYTDAIETGDYRSA